MCETYGVWAEKSMYGRKYMGIERSAFLIGPDGKQTVIMANLEQVAAKNLRAAIGRRRELGEDLPQLRNMLGTIVSSAARSPRSGQPARHSPVSRRRSTVESRPWCASRRSALPESACRFRNDTAP